MTGYGFEDRTTAVINYIKKQFAKEKHLFEYAFCFGTPSSEIGRSEKWQRNKHEIDDFLTTFSETYIQVPTSIRDPIEISLLFRKVLEENDINFSEYYTLIDITCFPKTTLLSVLTELLDRNSKGTLLYAEPEDYELPFSIGAKYLGILPHFGRFYNPSRKRILMIVLGFEGDRSYTVWDNCDPDEVIAFVGEPLSNNLGWQKISEKENELILSQPKVEKDTISFVDPVKALEKLEEKYKEYKEENILIAPLGTKLSTVPIVYFARNKANVFVVSSTAERQAEHQSIGAKVIISCKFSNITIEHPERIQL
jgi:hypothetical protein